MQKQLMKQMQKMVQDNLARIQEDLGKEMVQGTAGGGMVVIEMNGRQEAVSVKIDPSVINAEEADMLEDLVLVAFKDALEKSQALSSQKMGQLTGGLQIPGLF